MLNCEDFVMTLQINFIFDLTVGITVCLGIKEASCGFLFNSIFRLNIFSVG